MGRRQIGSGGGLQMGDATHILVVDDEKEIRDNIRDYFEIHGFCVHEAAGGAEMREVIGRQSRSSSSICACPERTALLSARSCTRGRISASSC